MTGGGMLRRNSAVCASTFFVVASPNSSAWSFSRFCNMLFIKGGKYYLPKKVSGWVTISYNARQPDLQAPILRNLPATLQRDRHRSSSKAAPVPVCYDHALGRVMSLLSKLTLAGVTLGGLGSSGRRGSDRLRLGLGRRGGCWLGLGGPRASTSCRGSRCYSSIRFVHNFRSEEHTSELQ